MFRQGLEESNSVLDTVVVNHFNGMACAIPGWLSGQSKKWRVILVFILFFRVCQVSNGAALASSRRFSCLLKSWTPSRRQGSEGEERHPSPNNTKMSTQALTTTNMPKLKLLAKGKVRDIYALPDAEDEDKLLFVATDRISAFDVIMENVRNYETYLSVHWLSCAPAV